MKPQNIGTTEKAVLVFVFAILLAGFILFQVNLQAFETYIMEDGLVEWLTVLGLLAGAWICFVRFARLRNRRNWKFLAITLGLGLLLVVAAGEEISWGQRILGIKSSEFFEKNNAQGETNLHNLVVGGVKLNRLIFSFGLIAVMAIYLLIIPFIYKKKEGFRRWLDSIGVMIPQNYQVISILVVFALSETIRHGKRAELLEAGIALLFFLIIAYPHNKHIYNHNQISA